MDSSLARLDLASALGWRATIAATAIYVATFVLPDGRDATAVLLIVIAALALLDATRLTRRLAPATVRTPLAPFRDLERMRGLLDATGVALILLDETDRIVFANRAALLLAGVQIARIEHIPAIGEEAGAAILALPSGGRRLVHPPAGRAFLAAMGDFAGSDGARERLLSLQPVDTDLDAIQIEAWTAMTRVLAHEMMNSLTPIASLADSLSRRAFADADTATAIATIARRSEHLLRFVERYRALGDLPTPMPCRIDSAAWLASLAAGLRPELAARHIGLTLSGIDAPPALFADPELLERAMLNLVRNAADAVSGQEGTRIVLACRADRDGAMLTVADTGPPVPSARLEEMFVPFFTTKTGGSGIGLPLARQIATLHGGTLIARPNRDRGLTFTLTLPFRQGGRQDVTRDCTADVAPGGGKNDRRERPTDARPAGYATSSIIALRLACDF